MVVIRLALGGSHNRPYYNIVATDSRSRRDGRFIEKLGFSNPGASGAAESVRIDAERVAYWISVGAQVRPSVAKLIRNHA